MAGADRDYPFDTEEFDRGNAAPYRGHTRHGEEHSPGDVFQPEIALFHILAPIVGAFGRRGRLQLNYRDLAEANFGDGTGPVYRVRLDSLKPFRRILRNPDLGSGESYLDGQWDMEQGDLAGLLGMFCRNHAAMKRSLPGRIVLAAVKPFVRSPANDPARSRRNVTHHYDIGNDLYTAFLDEGMNYSCAFFAEPEQSLRDAQLNKLRTTIDRLEIPDGARVLDIGSGWGELTRLIASETSAGPVTGITLAETQLELARACAADMAGRRPEYRLVDYRVHAADNPQAYDRIVSIGMFEHVGARHFVEYFEAVRRLLCDDGQALIHSIMRPDRRETSPWVRKHIFPGGYIPTLGDMVAAAREAGLELAHEPYIHESFHYAETLRRWRRRFNEAWPGLDRNRYDTRFRRMWNFYLAGCEAAFDANGLYVGQVVFRKA